MDRHMTENILEYNSGLIAARLERSEKALVTGVSFRLSAGERLSLIGETGSGKTMTALSIMGLLPSNVTMRGGSVRFLGEELTGSGSIRQLLGDSIVYIPQNGSEFLNPSRNVRHHLYDSLKKLGVRKPDLERTSLEKLALAGFPQPRDVLDKYPFQLSGGMAQRVTIALSACSRARLILADEPTNGLDQAGKADFLSLLDRLFPDAGKLIITHDIALAALCHRTVVLCGGRMMERGPSTEILEHPRHPYTQALIASLVANGMHGTPLLRRETAECPFYRRCLQAGDCQGLLRPNSAQNVDWWCGA